MMVVRRKGASCAEGHVHASRRASKVTRHVALDVDDDLHGSSIRLEFAFNACCGGICCRMLVDPYFVAHPSTVLSTISVERVGHPGCVEEETMGERCGYEVRCNYLEYNAATSEQYEVSAMRITFVCTTRRDLDGVGL